jgi:putative transcriptional regulator
MLSLAAARAVAPPAPAVVLHRRASAARARDRRVGHVIRLAPTVSSVATRAKRSDDEDKADVSEAADGAEGSDGKSSDASDAASADASPSDASATAPETKKSDASETKKDEEQEPDAKASVEGDSKEGSASLLSSAEDDVAPALEGDWRDFRARLVSMESGAGSSTDEEEKVEEASGPNLELLREQNPALAAEKPWAHVIGAPERGCLLVARGDNFTQGQQYFHQAVILMLEHNEKGSMGVILNRPTQYSMGYVSGDESGPFSENALYFGGDVGDGTVSFLHGSSSVSGSVEVSNGVFLGGYESACELVKQGEVEANDCKFFARYCGWGPGQLKSECERGVWYPVACSKQIALKQVIQLPKPLWREVSELVGGDVGYESRKAYGEATKEDAEKYGDGDDE